MATSKKTGDQINHADWNPNLKTDALTVQQRYAALSNIWNNPNAGSTTCGRQQTYADTEKQNKFQSVVDPFDNSGVIAPAAGTTIYANNINKAAAVIDVQATSANSLTSSAIAKTGVSVTAGTTIDHLHVNNMITTIINIIARYDAYNSYWDANNLCQRSCQVACQTACQTSCQGCNTSQCHNQKCGAH